MQLIFGFDIGTTSIGFAVIRHDHDLGAGEILRLGVRVFPEARDPSGTPLNQERRQARLRRRQLRRRRERRRMLGDALNEAGLLPCRGSPGWNEIMGVDPYELRKRAFDGDKLSQHEIGRAIYHHAQRRHFKGRDVDEVSSDSESPTLDSDERKAESARDETIATLRENKKTLGAWLADMTPHQRKRGRHAVRSIVEEEFDGIWLPLVPVSFRDAVRNAIFSQRPVFWRLNTLGKCPFIPAAGLCPRSSWLSQQRRMLEKLNNLSLVGSNQRPLDDEEREAILSKLQEQASMTWPGVRRTLAPLYRARGISGDEKRLKFNLEEGQEKKLLGNAVEAKLAEIFGDSWRVHPHKQEIRDSVPDQLWQADYEEVGGQRVIILPANKRKSRRKAAVDEFIKKFDLTKEQAEAISKMKLPSGWEPYSTEALRVILPHLEAGVKFGEIVNSPDWESWLSETFPDREQPTGEEYDRLPSPAEKEEREDIAKLRNPTVVRTRNELRKVVNNLIGMYGKPDLIRVEVARDVGNSKRQREEKTSGIRRREKRRKEAWESLKENKIESPSRNDIEKWLLWKECKHRCPFSGDSISFDALFRNAEFEVEHIWPRSRSLDNSFANKTLCRKDINQQKGNRIPYEFLHGNSGEWEALTGRLFDMKAPKGGPGMSSAKIRRFLAPEIPDDFATRQLNDTGYAAREAVAYLKKLWPDQGIEAAVHVFSVSGRVTAHLRHLWGLSNILAPDGKKTRSDHRHHAIDALTVACSHPGMTQKLSRYWQAEDDPSTPQPSLPLPWKSIRSDAEQAVSDIVVSHRVRKKVSGALHKETIYGDTGKETSERGGTTYRYFVTRKNVEDISKSDLNEKNRDLWPDPKLREIVLDWINERGGEPKKAFPPYPKKGRKGPEIRKVRLRMKRQADLMARVSTGYADLGNNHHMAIYRKSDGDSCFEVVSLMEASRRLASNQAVVQRSIGDGSTLLMTLSPGDIIEFQKGDESGLWVVHGINSSGRPVLGRLNDARPTTANEAHRLGVDGKRNDFEPRFRGFMKRQPKKLSVDPIGRVRSAND